MNKKFKSAVFSIIAVVLIATSNITIFANDTAIEHASNKNSSNSTNGTAITVVVPTQSERPQPQAEPKPILPILYPVAVSENRENNRREIIRVYELADNENPDHIPREPFEREGYYYELAEIVKGEMMAFDSREHIEPITVNTTSNDLTTVMKLLTQTIEHQSEDGYVGVLTLDTSTIKIEQAGTRTNTSTQRRTREYPHLSSNDLSLVPKTISEGGRTYHLENVDWKSASTEAIDYTQLAQTYTAVATYSAQVSSTSVTGYNTTAEYKGVISKTSQGKVRYSATYFGIPIVSPILNKPSETTSLETEENSDEVSVCEETGTIIDNSDNADDTIDTQDYISSTDDTDTDANVESEAETDAKVEVEEEMETENQSNGISPTVLIILLVVVAVIAYFVGKFGKQFISKMKKPTAMMLVGAILVGALSLPQSVYASSLSSLPSYGFGNINTENSTHIDTTPIDNNNADINGSYHFGITNNQTTDNGSAPTYHMELGASDYNSSQFGYTEGQLIGKLTVEKLNRTINVYEGESLASMNKGGGRFSNTGANTGNTAIIGHNRGRSNGFFIFVKDLQQGDIVRLEMNGLTKRYAVSHLYTVSETDTSPLGQFGDSRLTLTTCVEGVQSQRRIAVLFEVGS